MEATLDKQEGVEFVEYVKFTLCPVSKQWIEIHQIKSNKEEERPYGLQSEVCNCGV